MIKEISSFQAPHFKPHSLHILLSQASSGQVINIIIAARCGAADFAGHSFLPPQMVRIPQHPLSFRCWARFAVRVSESPVCEFGPSGM
jgi:hypothetical protein